jgi:predicted TIM-barrel fold metal-dependent hydrolase
MAEIKHLISADSHLVEPYDLWEKALGAKWGLDAVPHLIPDGDDGPMLFTGLEYIPVAKGIIDQTAPDPDVRALVLRAGADPDARVQCLDIDGVDYEVLNSTWMLYSMRMQNADLRRDCARVYNDWAAEFVSSHPDRFTASAMLPVDDIGWACEELERVTSKGMKGAVIFCAVLPGMTPYRDRSYDVLWQKAVETSNPIMLHIITGNQRDPFTMRGDELGEAAGATVAILQEVQPTLANEFIFGRILDNFPELKVGLGEYEVAWLPNFMWRLHQLANDYPSGWGLRDLKQPVDELALKRVYHSTIDDPYVLMVLDQLGTDINLTWGSDFPHVRCTFPGSRDIVADRLKGLPQDVVDRVTHQTAMELFDISLPAKV